jgi:hypothetical protein
MAPKSNLLVVVLDNQLIDLTKQRNHKSMTTEISQAEANLQILNTKIKAIHRLLNDVEQLYVYGPMTPQQLGVAVQIIKYHMVYLDCWHYEFTNVAPELNLVLPATQYMMKIQAVDNAFFYLKLHLDYLQQEFKSGTLDKNYQDEYYWQVRTLVRDLHSWFDAVL